MDHFASGHRLPDPLSSSGATLEEEEEEEEGDRQQVEAIHQLLEENWFFGKCLDGKKSRMFRKYAAKVNHCSRNVNESTRESSETSLRLQEPMKPTTCSNKAGIVKQQEIKNRSAMNMQPKMSPNNLLRAPSLPPNIGRETEEIDGDDESDVSMSRLIRQAMPYSSGILPRRRASQGKLQSSSTTKYRPPINSEAESTSTSNTNTLPRKEPVRRDPNQRRLQRCLSNLEFQETQEFKDLGFRFNKKDSCPSPFIAAPLQPSNSRRPLYRQQGCAPPLRVCADKSSAEDIKAQIKFWARAVASNVR